MKEAEKDSPNVGFLAAEASALLLEKANEINVLTFDLREANAQLMESKGLLHMRGIIGEAYFVVHKLERVAPCAIY